MPLDDPLAEPAAGKSGSGRASMESASAQLSLWNPPPTRVEDLEALAVVTQLDDAGSNTDDLYEWQAAMAAADGLSLFFDALTDDGVLDPECDDFILCEWHEDWVVFGRDGTELVSGKHRSADAGAYTTVNLLADKGGLAHLFNRWFALGMKPMCRLVTTGGLTVGPARDLKDAAHRLHELRTDGRDLAPSEKELVVVKQLHKAINSHDEVTAQRWKGTETHPAVPEEEQFREVVGFLASLRIATVEMSLGVVRDAAPTKYVKPVLERMGLSTANREAVWEAVLSLFRERMQSHGETSYGDLPSVLQRDRSGGFDPEVRRRIARRLVKLEDIRTAIGVALTMPKAFAVVPPLPPISRVEIKMAEGGCSSNAVGRATALRVDYENHWRDLETGDPTARPARKKLEGLLRRVSDHEMGDSELSGTRLWRALERKVVELEETGQLPAGVDSEIALGGICDLSNRCEVWFGPKFDVAAMIASRRSGGVAVQP